MVLTGDLKQAFLKVRIERAERDTLRFHWAPDEQSDIETLRFITAILGLTKQHLASKEIRAPEVVSKIRKSMYVDDLISGKTTVIDTQQSKKEATEVFQLACFTLYPTKITGYNV